MIYKLILTVQGLWYSPQEDYTYEKLVDFMMDIESSIKPGDKIEFHTSDKQP